MAFTDTLTRWLESFVDGTNRAILRSVFKPLYDRYSTQPLASAGLTIKSGGSALAKTGETDFYASVNGVLVTIAAATDMPALVGSITATKFNVFCFFVDQSGTKTVAMGTEGAALANIVFPQFPEKKALIGFLIVTYASTFVGGTTPLDTATTVYVSPLGPFDPAVLIGN